MSLQRKKCNQWKEMLQWKNDFESPGSIYVNTNRKYSPGNLLELEASHLLEPELCNAVIIQKTNKRITYSPVPETKYNLAESCVNMWWNFAVLFWIVYKASWPAKSSHRIQCIPEKAQKKRVREEKQKFYRIQPITVHKAISDQQSLSLWCLSFSTLHLQKQCYIFY